MKFHDCLEKNKIYLDYLLLIATIFMAIATYLAVVETRHLKENDLGPNISLSDVFVTTIDDTSTPIKKRSWVQGELLNNNAVYITTSKFVVSVKLYNSGKVSGYVELLGFFDSKNNKLEYIKTPAANDTYLVPANSHTGEIYNLELDVVNDFNLEKKENQEFKYKMRLQIFGKNFSRKEIMELSVRCTLQYDDKYNTYQVGCSPIN